MDDTVLEALAKAAGLGKALAEHREDVLQAARDTIAKRARVPAPATQTIEPWPPMRAGVGL